MTACRLHKEGHAYRVIVLYDAGDTPIAGIFPPLTQAVGIYFEWQSICQGRRCRVLDLRSDSDVRLRMATVLQQISA